MGRRVSETEAYHWSAEVDAHYAALERAAMAAEPQHPLLRHRKVGVWSRLGRPSSLTGNRSSAYYIWGPGHSGARFTLFSEFAHRFGRAHGLREKLGEYDSLDEAVAAGEAFLGRVTVDFILADSPLYHPENVVLELERLPEAFPLPTVAEVAAIKGSAE